MFIALDKDKNKISINDATMGEEYFCPICFEPLIVRAENSDLVAKHFAHKRGTQCTDDWKYEMSEWHLAWQNKFPVECREVVMENEGEKHRADVFIHNIVIEFQHSPITYEDFTKRNLFYIKCGYEIVWIFDAKKMIKTPIEKIIEPIATKIKNKEFRKKDCYEREFEWKRKPRQFYDFGKGYPQGSRVAIYLETNIDGNEDKIILPLKHVDSLFPTAQHYEPYITAKSFLKEYGLLDDPNIPSVSLIIANTRAMQNYIQKQLH